MSRRDWPTIGPAETFLFTVLVLGAVAVGVTQGGVVLAGLLDPLCTPAACSPVGLAVVGWAVVGGPLVLPSLVLLVSRPGAAARNAMLGCVVLFSFGLSAAYSGGGDLRSTYPDVVPFGVGATAAVLALVLGAAIGGPAHVTSWERPRYSTTARLPGAAPPLFAVAICQGLALIAVLLWTTVLR